MSKVYDPLDNGLAQLNKDLDKLMNDLIFANQVAIQSLEPLVLSRIHYYGNANTNLDNFREVVANNNFTYRRNKYAPTLRIHNTSKQATFAEFGYGIVGSANQAPKDLETIYGYLGWEGYDLDTPYKLDDRGWWHKKQITWGEKSVPTYYRTYRFFEQRLAQIVCDKLVAVLNKL